MLRLSFKSLFTSGTPFNDFWAGTAGDDRYDAGAGNDVVLAGAGNDKILGGDGADYLRGGTGNDRIDGGTGKDSLFGDDGDDLLVVGTEDTATGGTGADTFSITALRDARYTITDFNAAEGDIIDLTLRDGVTWSVIDADATHATISFSNGATLDLYGHTAAEITATPDIFGL